MVDCPAPSAPAFHLGKRSLKRLHNLHPDLIEIVKQAIDITPVDFAVLEGLRTRARQRKLVAAGASRTMNSRHLTGHAVDLGAWVAGSVRWDWPLYDILGAAMKQAASDLQLPIEWGGDWRTFRDGPHFQLPRKQYPAVEGPARSPKDK